MSKPTYENKPSRRTASRSNDSRASESGRRQRDGTAFTGAFGNKTGSSANLFVEGQLPESDGRLRIDGPPSRQLERCLAILESELERRGRTADDVLKLTLYLAEMDAYEDVDETYRSYFDETRPARTTVASATPRRRGRDRRCRGRDRVTDAETRLSRSVRRRFRPCTASARRC
ncbi:RidA family protein [Haloterrigena turkmenica]|uniref:RidA family protein n=1 Tax=Haloterrigena turkmenica TaxID=62320 RepID=UPI001CF7ADF7|nr:RidA family protein [Haloterrigena turkmenica]